MLADYVKPAYSLLLSILILASLTCSAQSEDGPGTVDYKQIFSLLDQQKYDQSLILIREAFGTVSDNVPDTLIYCYGRALMGAGEYVRARNAFNEYLKSSDHLVYKEQVHVYLTQLQSRICAKCDNSGYHDVMKPCGKCNGSGGSYKDCTACSKAGNFACSVCSGKGVLVKNGSMGKVFKECPDCNGKGVAVCRKCKGEQRIKLNCDICQGKGEISLKQVCTH